MRRRTILAVLAAAAVAACALYKPVRVLTPELFGLTCPIAGVCVEDLGELETAKALRQDAIAFVEKNLGSLKIEPRILFCSTTTCFQRFGNPKIAGQNVGTYGIAINKTGWNNYILRHEVIHHWQNENFGVTQTSILLPRWFIEGMAYTLSRDPRRPIPHPEAEGYRVKFNAWIKQGNDWRVPPS